MSAAMAADKKTRADAAKSSHCPRHAEVFFLELRSPYRVLLVDRSPWPCGHVVPFSFLGIRSRHSIILLLCRKRPDHPRHFVRQGNGGDHLRLACHQCGQPAVCTAASANHPADYAHGANDQQSSDVGLPHFADRSQSGLSARRPLSWDQTQPSGKVAAAVKCIKTRSECRDSACGDRADTGDSAKPAQLLICLR